MPGSLILIFGGGLHLVDPIPLTPNDLHRHCAGHRLFERIDGGKSWNGNPQDNDSWDVEEEVLRLHQKLVITEEIKAPPWPKRNVLLRDLWPERSDLLRWFADNPRLA